METCWGCLPRLGDAYGKWNIDRNIAAHTLPYRPCILLLADGVRPVLIRFALEARIPSNEKTVPGFDVGQIPILKWSLQLSAHDILNAIIRDDVVSISLIRDRYCLLYKPSFFEIVVGDE
jgi:hypothetical protein